MPIKKTTVTEEWLCEECQHAYASSEDAEQCEKRHKDPLGSIVYAAYGRCLCGAGMAYLRAHFPKVSAWECSAILRGQSDQELTHEAPLPFAFYEIKSESQVSVYGATTREPLTPQQTIAMLNQRSDVSAEARERNIRILEARIKAKNS